MFEGLDRVGVALSPWKQVAVRQAADREKI